MTNISQYPGAIIHNGVIIYPLKTTGGDLWAVESADNKHRRLTGDRNRGGDSLHKTVEEAKREADFEAKLHVVQQANRAELEVKEKAAQATEQAKKEANKGLSLSGIKARIYMTQEVLDSKTGRRVTRTQWVDNLVKSGEKPSVRMIDKIKPMSRAAYNRANNQEQIAHERKIKAGGKVEEYSLGDYTISKTEYDHAVNVSS